ncbi:MAG: hypothetical protein IKM99_07775 [Bacteroidales bacterium]|nr:hypothetical protein [Bacteroidales bacterium]
MRKVTLFCVAFLAMCCLASCRGPKTNANVYSSTVTVYESDWRWDNTSWRVDLRFDAINLNVHNDGAVLVYMDNENTWRQLPMTFYYTDYDNQGNLVNCSSSLEVSSYDGGVSIFWTENDFYNGRRIGTHRFKIVTISNADYSARPDVDYSNYEEVKRVFQIKED